MQNHAGVTGWRGLAIDLVIDLVVGLVIDLVVGLVIGLAIGLAIDRVTIPSLLLPTVSETSFSFFSTLVFLSKR